MKNTSDPYKFINLGQNIVKQNDDMDVFYGQK